ncbi:GPI mannosyltransferase 1, partial [Spiromyces aspiralis]
MGINFNPTFYDVFTTGLALRLGMLLYGLWMDTHFAVKYTDIDYHVFTDAARYVFDGHSPYLRSTYRYTPLLAWALTPNMWLNPSFGKLLFIAFDCVVGYLIHRILIMRGVGAKQSTMLAALWMLNPQVANISSRGSAESMIGAATLLSFYCLMKKQLGTSAVIFGLAVHLKLYPIIYALPLLVVLDKPVFEPRPPRSSSPPCSGSIIERLVGWSNIYRVKFAIISASTFFALNLLMFYIYGYEFLDETYLYHVVRKDHRHNFSIWFLPIYLNLQNQSDSLIGLASFVPQLLVVAVLGVKFGKDLFFAVFIQTFAFVTYNKVCTAQ